MKKRQDVDTKCLIFILNQSEVYKALKAYDDGDTADAELRDIGLAAICILSYVGCLPADKTEALSEYLLRKSEDNWSQVTVVKTKRLRKDRSITPCLKSGCLKRIDER